MEDWGWFRRLRYGTMQCIGLGFVAGALETVGLASALKLPLSVVDFVAMGLADVALMGIVGLFAGLMAGVVVIPDARAGETTAQLVARQMAGAGFLLCGFYLWQGAFSVWEREQPAGAIAMAIMPLGFGGVVYFNARFWLRKTELGKGPRIGWLPVAAAIAGLVVGIAGLLYPSRDTGGSYALEGDPNVVIVSVDGLRRTDPVPTLDAVAAQGFRLDDAVAPSTETGPSAATVLTGLHPLRHKLLYDGDKLSLGWRTLPEALEMEGYATGGFVSREEAGVSGNLDQGFRVFDDDFAPFLPGVARVNLIWRVRQGLRLALGAERGRRAPEDTVARFETWYAQKSGLPHFAWVHLAVAEDADVAALDRAVARVVAAIDDAGRADDTLLILTGANGRPAGRRFLTDPEVRVPMAIRAPGVRVDVPVVPHQIRLMDVAATVMDFVKLDTLGETEGVTLIGYAQGLRKAPMSCGLVGRDDAGKPLLGMRNSGVKWVRDAEDGDHLFNLTDDPEEANDLVEAQPKAVRQARTLMSPEIVAFRTLIELR